MSYDYDYNQETKHHEKDAEIARLKREVEELKRSNIEQHYQQEESQDGNNHHHKKEYSKRHNNKPKPNMAAYPESDDLIHPIAKAGTLHPALTSLAQYDGVKVHQKVESIEIALGVETANRYSILPLKWKEDSDSHHHNNNASDKKSELISKDPILYAIERSSFISKMWLGANRNLDFKVRAPDGSIALVVHRPFKIIKKNVKVFDGPSRSYLGRVQKHFNVVSKSLEIIDVDGNTIYTIKGPKIPGHHTLKIRKGKEIVGYIKKRWGGFIREAFTDADDFDIKFPVNSSVTERCLLLAATLFFDMLYYEKQPQ